MNKEDFNRRKADREAIENSKDSCNNCVKYHHKHGCMYRKSPTFANCELCIRKEF